jgi:hypothetical protein
MVIFHSYVKLPEGIYHHHLGIDPWWAFHDSLVRTASLLFISHLTSYMSRYITVTISVGSLTSSDVIHLGALNPLCAGGEILLAVTMWIKSPCEFRVPFFWTILDFWIAKSYFCIFQGEAGELPASNRGFVGGWQGLKMLVLALPISNLAETRQITGVKNWWRMITFETLVETAQKHVESSPRPRILWPHWFGGGFVNSAARQDHAYDLRDHGFLNEHPNNWNIVYHRLMNL